jgi:hypothetical protein
MKTMWEPVHRREIHARVAGVTLDRKAHWGRMSAPQMMCHLAPFPKNVPTAPELIARTPGDWKADVREVQSLVDRFIARGSGARWPDHPAFGRLSSRAWGVLVYRHMDHHLRQFGA